MQEENKKRMRLIFKNMNISGLPKNWWKGDSNGSNTARRFYDNADIVAKVNKKKLIDQLV